MVVPVIHDRFLTDSFQFKLSLLHSTLHAVATDSLVRRGHEQRDWWMQV
jgi:hypothetical protein